MKNPPNRPAFRNLGILGKFTPEQTAALIRQATRPIVMEWWAKVEPLIERCIEQTGNLVADRQDAEKARMISRLAIFTPPI